MQVCAGEQGEELGVTLFRALDGRHRVTHVLEPLAGFGLGLKAQGSESSQGSGVPRVRS